MDEDPRAGRLSVRVGRVAAPLREQVLDLLREAILDFRYEPGQRLIERELIEEIGVSRTTIREVLRELDAEGLVTTIPQRGVIVVVPTPEEALEIYEVRAALEALAARKFVDRATDEQLVSLRAAADAYSEIVAGGAGIREILQAKDRFYDVLIEGAGNQAIGTILSGLQARVRAMRAASLSRPGRPQVVAEELLVIVAAAERRDGDAAAQATVEHLSNSSTSGLQVLAPTPTQ
jgi:GntR family transcriptional regulator, trigonelline degradation regulator